MLKHSICGLVFVGLATSAAPAVDLVWEPTELFLGVPTIVSIYIQANDADFAYGGGVFGLVDPHGVPLPSATPDGGLSYDLDGPDDTPFTADDGWVWKNGLERTGSFLVSINPAESIIIAFGASQLRVPANERILVATIELTGTSVGNFRLVPSHAHFSDTFNDVTIKAGAEPVFSVSVRPALGACCVDSVPSSCMNGVIRSDCRPTDSVPDRRWVQGVACDELDPPCGPTCFETIGGAIYADCDEPLTTGEPDVEVTIVGPEGVFSARTAGGLGVWSIADVPCGEYRVTPHQAFREYCHVNIGDGCPPESCDNTTTITVDPANRAENLSIQFLGREGCIKNDLNYDQICTIVNDTELFVQCVYEGDCIGSDGRNLTCPADCNCDGLATIVFDAACFVHQVYVNGACGECGGDPGTSSLAANGRRTGFTIGGAVYDDASNPLFSGVDAVTVQVFGARRKIVATTTTAGPSGIWRVDGLPEGNYSVVIERRRSRVAAGRDVIPIAVNAKNEAANLSIAVLRAWGSMRPRNLRPDRWKLAGERGKPSLGLNGEIFFVENGVDPAGFGGGPTIVDISQRLGEEITFDIYVQAIGMLTPVRGIEADFPCVGQGGTGGSVAYVQDSGKIDQFLRSDFLFRFMQVSMGIDQSNCPDGNVRFAVALVNMDKDITGLGPLYAGNFTVAVSGDAAGSHTFPLIGSSGLVDLDSDPIPAFRHELVLVASDGKGDRPTIKHGDFETTNTQPCSGYIDPRSDSKDPRRNNLTVFLVVILSAAKDLPCNYREILRYAQNDSRAK